MAALCRKEQKRRTDPGGYIVSGPVADDRTASVIDLYLDGMYDEEETIKRLLPQKLKDQYTFKTEEAIVLLNFRGVNLP